MKVSKSLGNVSNEDLDFSEKRRKVVKLEEVPDRPKEIYDDRRIPQLVLNNGTTTLKKYLTEDRRTTVSEETHRGDVGW